MSPRKCSPAMMMITPAILLSSGKIGDEQLADYRGRGAERDEHGGEAEHEGDRGHHDRRIDVGRRLVLAGELLEGGAAEEAEIRRDERQHAGAQEAQEPRDQRSEISDVQFSVSNRRRLES